MEFKDSDRLKTRLFALHLRLSELDHEMRQTQIRVRHLESQLEDAQLAKLMGQEAGNPAEISPELERSRGSLESQQEVIERVKKIQWKARGEYMLLRAKERREDRERDTSEVHPEPE